MHMIDRLEKLGRLVLWLSLAATCIAALVTYVAAVRAASDVQTKLERAQEDLQEALTPKPPDPIPRLALESMGPAMRSLNTREASAHLYFSNVSARRGVVCAVATASNGAGQRTASLPSCIEIGPYATGLHLDFMFAGGDLAGICKAGDCTVTIANKDDDAPGPAPGSEPPTAPAPPASTATP